METHLMKKNREDTRGKKDYKMEELHEKKTNNNEIIKKSECDIMSFILAAKKFNIILCKSYNVRTLHIVSNKIK